MLILTRRIGERLMIGDDVVIDILQINGRQVRLGITAPKNITVLREEVYQESKAVKKVVNNQKTKGQLL